MIEQYWVLGYCMCPKCEGEEEYYDTNKERFEKYND